MSPEISNYSPEVWSYRRRISEHNYQRDPLTVNRNSPHNVQNAPNNSKPAKNIENIEAV